MNPQGRGNIAQIADLVCTNIAQSIAIGSQRFVVAASIGVAVYPSDGTTGDKLIKNADTAMCHAKLDESCLTFFDQVQKVSAGS